MEKVYSTDPELIVEPAYYSGGVPVFEPTMAQFQDFYKFNKAINEYGMKSGIVKVVPPQEWHAQLQGTYTEENLEQITIKNPIVQNMNVSAGYKGIYSCQNVEKHRKYNIRQWKTLAQQHSNLPPAHKQNRRGSSPMKEEIKEEIGPENRINTRRRSKALGPRLIDGILRDSFNIDVSEFTSERCDELELLYWKSLGYAEPMYGADMLGSLFKEKTTKSWNVAKLPNLLDLMDEKLPGVNDAYLYAGLWKATFSWHLEDQDLYSINYLHFGAPKQWYSIPQSQNGKFFKLMLEIFDEDYKNCLEFLRHKTFLASPQFLEKHGITCNKIVHKQGEYMITYPYGYHAGFNYGYNLAESVNFALDDWFEYAKKARKCECIGDSVGINYHQIYCKYKGIPYPLNQDKPTHMPTKRRASTIGIPEFASQVKSKAVSKKQCVSEKHLLKPATQQNQCILCPNNLPPQLLMMSKFELLDTDQRDPRTEETLQVHRICGEMFHPQVNFASGSLNKEIVTGINTIARPYRNLKCLVCRKPNRILTSTKTVSRGACFQCSASTCTKSYHATCALNAGFLFNKDCCKTHRPSVSPYYARGDTELHEKLTNLPDNSIVQYTFKGTGRRHTGETKCGLVLKNLALEKILEVVLYPELTEYLNVHYDDVIYGKAPELDNLGFIDMSVSVNPGRSSRKTTLHQSIHSLETELSPEPHVLGNKPEGSIFTTESNYSFAGPVPNLMHENNDKKEYVFVNEFSKDSLVPQVSPGYSGFRGVVGAVLSETR